MFRRPEPEVATLAISVRARQGDRLPHQAVVTALYGCTTIVRAVVIAVSFPQPAHIRRNRLARHPPPLLFSLAEYLARRAHAPERRLEQAVVGSTTGTVAGGPARQLEARRPATTSGRGPRDLLVRARNGIWQLIQALGLQEPDVVLVPSYNCGAELDAVLRAPATVRFYRVDRSARIDVDDLRQAIEPRTRAVIVTHYFGFPQPDLVAIGELCRDHGLFLIEDCAHALYSTHLGRSLGTFGDAERLQPVEDASDARRRCRARKRRRSSRWRNGCASARCVLHPSSVASRSASRFRLRPRG